jgi:pimeloyl-ACP methyl ester carboxylesterase
MDLGPTFCLAGFSMGGEVMWSCLKYIPHRLSGVAILSPVGNYWWAGFPANVSREAWNVQVPQDKWAVRMAHHTPWLTYWWNTQMLFPASSVISFNPAIMSREDMAVLPQVRLQGALRCKHVSDRSMMMHTNTMLLSL